MFIPLRNISFVWRNLVFCRLDSCDLSMGTDRMANEDRQDGNEYLESVLVAASSGAAVE